MAETASVAINRPFSDGLTYSVPPELQDILQPGHLVSVPLGNANEVGCVTELDPPVTGPYSLKPIVGFASPGYQLAPELLALCRFVAGYYQCGLGEALSAASMVGFNDLRPRRVVAHAAAGDWEAHADGLTPRRRAVMERLAGLGPAPLAQLATAAGTTTATLKALEAEGFVVEATIPTVEVVAPPPQCPLTPSPDQEAALAAIEASTNAFRVFLLFGITGSGKTEVYLQAMSRALAAGRSVLCLVPEISLTPQTVDRFRSRFQMEMGVFHSHLTRLEKLRLYERIQSGAIRIVIGARSAIFAPLPRLGLIVVDEEHEGSYKQGEVPRYHARDVGIVRAQQLGIPIVLGSATPSLESFQKALDGKYHLLRLPTRATDVALPPVRLVDLGAVARETGESSLLSPALRDAVRRRLDAGEQSLLFLNRRGFSNFVFCPSCKWVAKCTEDDVALTLHAARKDSGSEGDLVDMTEGNRREWMRCHFCGARHDRPTVCPKCQGTDLAAIGAGTQRVEEELRHAFPDARILRMDYDTITGRDAHARAWEEMSSDRIDIILGTQMIAKGLHLDRVSLVGVILADVGLFIPDFRAEERSFSLLTQVAGRAGRTREGEALIQTYMPHHTAVRLAQNHDYEGFFAEEIRRRRNLDFPPILRLAALTISDPDRERAFETSRVAMGVLRRLRHHDRFLACRINGPNAAPIARLAGRFRFRILVRSASANALGDMLRAMRADAEYRIPSSTRVSIDVDPMDLM